MVGLSQARPPGSLPLLRMTAGERHGSSLREQFRVSLPRCATPERLSASQESAQLLNTPTGRRLRRLCCLRCDNQRRLRKALVDVLGRRDRLVPRPIRVLLRGKIAPSQNRVVKVLKLDVVRAHLQLERLLALLAWDVRVHGDEQRSDLLLVDAAILVQVVKVERLAEERRVGGVVDDRGVRLDERACEPLLGRLETRVDHLDAQHAEADGE
eukprot:4344916-Prymnesium_polylepis.4